MGCVVVVFGGGWHKGDKTKFRALAIELANRGYVTAAIEYRLADEAPFPAGIQVGELDTPERNQPSRDKLTSLGIETGVLVVKDAKHGCWNRLPWFAEMVEEMDQFFGKHLK